MTKCRAQTASAGATGNRQLHRHTMSSKSLKGVTRDCTLHDNATVKYFCITELFVVSFGYHPDVGIMSASSFVDCIKRHRSVYLMI